MGMGEEYAQAVYTLYRAGVLSGSDAAGAFRPLTSITRCEAAAIVTRMARSDARVGLSLTAVTSDPRRVERPENRYDFIVSDCSWNEAFWKAREAGGHLVRIETRAEYDDLLARLNETGLTDIQFRIGARYEGGYYWMDLDNRPTGDKINTENYWAKEEWAPGEPSYRWNGTEEDTLELYYHPELNKWTWNDVPNQGYAGSRYGYIIEYELY